MEDREELVLELPDYLQEEFYEENYDIEIFIRSLSYREVLTLMLLSYSLSPREITQVFGFKDRQNQMARRAIRSVKKKFLQFNQR